MIVNQPELIIGTYFNTFFFSLHILVSFLFYRYTHI